MQNGNGMYMNHQTAPPATHYSIDVECVATGRDHNSRAVAQISLVVWDLEFNDCQLTASVSSTSNTLGNALPPMQGGTIDVLQ